MPKIEAGLPNTTFPLRERSVNGYHLIRFTHLFRPLLVRVLMVKFPNVSLIFATLSWSLAFHTTSESLIPREFRNGKKCAQNWAEFFQFLCQPVGSGFLKQDSQNTTWASAHALSMVTWYHQNIVNGYHLIRFTHLFRPLLVRVLMVKFPIVSLIFATLPWSFACQN